MKIHFARILAHLYCLFHWSWRVCWGGSDSKKPEKPEWIGAASGCMGKGDFRIEAFTYPEWLILVEDDEWETKIVNGKIISTKRRIEK